MRLVSWNRKGLGYPLKGEVIKDILKIESPDIIMLQETKIEGEPLLDLSRVKWKRNAGNVVSARGSSGGISMVWLNDKFQLESSFETQHWIYTKLCHFASKLTFALFNIYVPIHFLEKKECWKYLIYFIEIYSHVNIIVVRDLNIVLDPKEKRGGINSRDQVLRLLEDLIQ